MSFVPCSQNTYMRVRWVSGRALDSGAKGPGFEPHDSREVSLVRYFKLSRVMVITQEAVALPQDD